LRLPWAGVGGQGSVGSGQWPACTQGQSVEHHAGSGDPAYKQALAPFPLSATCPHAASMAQPTGLGAKPIRAQAANRFPRSL